MKDKFKRLVRHLSAWAWADEIETTKQAGGVLRWKSEYDWWHWYVVEVGTKGGHWIGSHADPMVRKAWDAARERMPNAHFSGAVSASVPSDHWVSFNVWHADSHPPFSAPLICKVLHYRTDRITEDKMTLEEPTDPRFCFSNNSELDESKTRVIAWKLNN